MTGVDLVQWQLRIARGEPLDAPSAACTATRSRCGSTPRIRARSCRRRAAIERLRLPTSIRVDAGVAEGDEIGTSYDPMIAKLIAHGETRDEALDRLAAALAETEVGGVTTNLPFLRWLVAHPALRAGETTTAFLVEYPPLSRRRRRCPTARLARRVPAQPAGARARSRRPTSTPPRTRTAPPRSRARSPRRCPAR